MLISIIVPVYNVEDYLHRCIDSILAQTFTSYDVILVDDGSTDNSGRICDEYAKKYENIHVLHQQYRGVSGARNTGLEWALTHSDSQWLAFIDSDDYVHPKYLETLFQAATESNLPISICSYVRTSGEIPESPPICPSQVWDTEDFFISLNTNFILIWGKLYRKDLYAKVRFPRGLIHEDEFTTHKVLFATEKVAYIDTPLYYYFRNPRSITGTGWSEKRLVILDAFRERLKFLHSRKLQKAYRWQTQYYFDHIITYWGLLRQKYDSSSTPHDRFMLKHFRYALYCGRRSNQIPFHGNENFYEQAHPLFMELYWRWKGLCHKFSKKR